MGSILGLQTTESLAANRSNNARRKVHYDYPNSRAPLTGLLSLMDDSETLTDSTFGWYEEAWQSARSITAQVASGGPFATTSAGSTAVSSAITIAAGTAFFVKVVDVEQFRVRDVVQMTNMLYSTGSGTLTGWVTAITGSVLSVTALEATPATVSIATGNNGKHITVIGTATGEGDAALQNGRSTEPVLISNHTQIFRTTVGPWTGSALKMGQKWDSNPKYKKDCKDGALRHMEVLEKAALFGVRRATTTTNNNGITVPVRYAGGVEYYIKQWDKGNTTNGGAFDYRVGGSDLSAADWTLDSSEDKRGITISSAMTSAQMNELIRRSFQSQSDKSFEKLVFCGDRALSVITQWAQSKSMAMTDLNPKEESYGMSIKKITTPHGDWLFKTHPLFKENPYYSTRLMVLDLGDIAYHAMDGRDTELLTNRQNRNEDQRYDEWLTEATFEIRHPRRHMIIDGLTSILP